MPPPGLKTTQVRQMVGKRGLLIFLYGPPGAGKTTAAAEATKSPLASPGVLYDVEAGVTSVTHVDNLITPNQEDVPKTWQDIRRITVWYRDTPKERIEEKLLIFDNGSEISKMTLDYVVKDPTQKGGAHSSPEIQHWGRATTEYEIWVRMLRDIAGDKDITIIVTAWDRRRGGGSESPDTETAPAIPKDVLSFNTRLAEELPGLVDIVGYLTVMGSGKRKLTFEASPLHSAKFRRPKIEGSRNVPNTIIFGEDDSPIADIINTIKGGKPFPEKYIKRLPVPAPASTAGSSTKGETAAGSSGDTATTQDEK